jgi:hypothetical protein
MFASAGVLAAALLYANSAGAVTVLSYTLVGPASFGTGLGVHSDTTQSGNVLNAIVNQDGSAVTFSSNETIDFNGAGEATVDGSYSDLDVHFAKGWGGVTFDFQTGTPPFDSNMTLLVNGVALFDSTSCGALCVLGNGDNKFILTGPNIQDLQFNFDPAITEAKQFRLEFPTSIPEPTTWGLMLTGVFCIGAAMRMKRRRAFIAA